MDEALIRGAAAIGCVGLSIALAWTSGAGAQELRDPTRPPATLTALSSAPSAATAGPQLQTILIGRGAGGRQLAVIDGETVQLGDTFHGARVARIGDNEVVLARGRERQTLRLYAPDAATGGSHGVTPATTAPSR